MTGAPSAGHPFLSFTFLFLQLSAHQMIPIPTAIVREEVRGWFGVLSVCLESLDCDMTPSSRGTRALAKLSNGASQIEFSCGLFPAFQAVVPTAERGGARRVALHARLLVPRHAPLGPRDRFLSEAGRWRVGAWLDLMLSLTGRQGLDSCIRIITDTSCEAWMSVVQDSSRSTQRIVTFAPP